MYRIRFHGRGGQGIKTASRILGSAFFAEGFETQDAPLYGAERRGAPIYATVRAARTPIVERGPLRRPDLVVVADETLLVAAVAGVLAGVAAHTVLLVCTATSAQVWKERLRFEGPVLALPAQTDATADARFLGAICAGGAARLVGAISRSSLEHALAQELAGLEQSDRHASVERALAAWDRMSSHAGLVRDQEGTPDEELASPAWIDLAAEPTPSSEAAILVPATSVQVRTGLWRTMRPVIDEELCHRCSWICSTFCPDGAVLVDAEHRPSIDYDHCKGCLVCVAVCPRHAIRALPERDAQSAESAS
ncbi:MAG TPA: 2-oxoacid:acceptor oxidoreductase family protein [Myxococcota bacterium]|nr:2-oxoacid:acceptor oxidoreductase family protein [Myxococcota bacterium]